jgi:hypothetical protein
MRVEFHQGVPEGCTEWLDKNVGKGNITSIYDSAEYDWFYRRERVYPQGHDVFCPLPKFVHTITVNDPKLAMLFVLRWSR